MAVFLFAAVLRLVGLGEGSLTHDEAWRANFADHGGVAERARLPLLQWVVLWALQSGVGRSETVLRLPSALCGLAGVVLIWRVAQLRLGNGAALAAAAYVAFHYEAVTFSRVIKEFAWEMPMAVGLLGLGAWAYDRPTSRRTRIFLAGVLCGLAAGFTPIFVGGACLALLAFRRWRSKDREACSRRDLWIGCGFVAIATSAWYLWHRSSPHYGAVIYHLQTGYDVWPKSWSPGVLAAWAARSTWELARLAAGTAAMWDPLGTIVTTLFVLTAAVGAWHMKRRWRVGWLVMLVVWVMLVAGGISRQWPYGSFPSNLFMVALLAPCVGAGAALMWRKIEAWPARAAIVVLLFALPALRCAKVAAGMTPLGEHLRPVIQEMRANLEPGDTLFVYYATDDAFEFYWPHPPAGTLVEPRSDRGRGDLFEASFTGLLSRHARVWLLMTHAYGDERSEWSSRAAAHGDVVHHFSTGTADAWCIAGADRLNPSPALPQP
ncbi:MAG: glycosyltransferase family 39 protein [Phycisphaerales bacterium]|nr:glycosyltransferase family 39 protein [Phycisphaerales bacterium]